jgi:hypothetical protein
LLDEGELIPLQHTIHVSVNVDIAEPAVEKRGGSLETASDVGTFGTRADAACGARSYLEGAFIVTAKDPFPPGDFVVYR